MYTSNILNNFVLESSLKKLSVSYSINSKTCSLYSKFKSSIHAIRGSFFSKFNPLGPDHNWIYTVIVLISAPTIWLLKNKFSINSEMQEFEQSKLKSQEEIDYKRAIKTQKGQGIVSRVEMPPETLWGWFVFYWQVFHRFCEIGIIFYPIFILFPLYYFDTLKPYWWNLLRKSVEKAGGCWIKIAQWASTRPDLFPKELLENLTCLQSNCIAHEFKCTKSIIEKDYGVQLEHIFDKFESTPIASGSIAQVYRTVLKISGQQVAVKVLHPGIQRKIKIDLSIMYIFANLISYFPQYDSMNLPEVVETFAIRMVDQLDMRKEAKNLMRFGKNFEDNKSVIFPNIIDYMTTSNILVETYEYGQDLNSFLKTGSTEEERKILAKIGLRTFLTMMLVHNFIHADMHPGNLLVRKKLGTNELQLVFLDVGLISKLTPRDWTNFKNLFRYIVQGDSEQAARLIIEHSPCKDTRTTLSTEEKENFSRETGELFSKLRSNKISSIQIGVLLQNLLSIVGKYHVKIESSFATLCIAIVILEGIGKQLDPGINVLDQSIPYIMWSQKANLDDRLLFIREKAKEEFDSEDSIKNPLYIKLHNFMKPALVSMKFLLGFD